MKRIYNESELIFSEKPTHALFRDKDGCVFGILTVIGFHKKSKSHSHWYCKCECGNIVSVTSCNLVNGTKSCGCLQQKTASLTSRKHGYVANYSKPPTYRAWSSLRNRCMNPKNAAYPYYGGRGIKVCERWNDFSNFLADMGERPDGTSIDRINNDGNYEPENCRWATPREQANNQSRNKIIDYNGQSLTISQWSEIIGIDSRVIGLRLRRGWPVERALTVSVNDSRASLSRFLEHNGEVLTATQWADRMNVKVGFIYKKLYSGWNIEKIFSHIKIKHEKDNNKPS